MLSKKRVVLMILALLLALVTACSSSGDEQTIKIGGKLGQNSIFYLKLLDSTLKLTQT